MVTNSGHDAIQRVADLLWDLEAGGVRAIAVACLSFKLLTVHQEEFITLLVAKSVHKQFPIVMETSRVFVERSEE